MRESTPLLFLCGCVFCARENQEYGEGPFSRRKAVSQFKDGPITQGKVGSQFKNCAFARGTVDSQFGMRVFLREIEVPRSRPALYHGEMGSHFSVHASSGGRFATFDLTRSKHAPVPYGCESKCLLVIGVLASWAIGWPLKNSAWL